MKLSFLSAIFCAVLSCVLICIGCASVKKSVSLGVGVGAVTGAASLALISHETKQDKGALIGALSGAVVGGVASYLIHHQLQDRDAQVRKATLFNLEKYGLSVPSYERNKLPEVVQGVTFPVEAEDYVPTQRKGNQVMEGHRVWTIADTAQGEEQNDKEANEPKNGNGKTEQDKQGKAEQ